MGLMATSTTEKQSQAGDKEARIMKSFKVEKQDWKVGFAQDLPRRKKK